MPHRYIHLPFKAIGFAADEDATSPYCVTVAGYEIFARVDLRSGAVVSSGTKPYRRAHPPDALLTLGEVRKQLEETSNGPLTHLSFRAQQTTIKGELLHAWCNGAFVVGVVEIPDYAFECVALAIGSSEMLRLRASSAAALGGDGEYAACVGDDLLHLFHFDGSRIRSVSVGLPPSHYQPDVSVIKSEVRVVSGDKLLLIDASQFEFADNPRGEPIDFEALSGPGIGHAAPAKVEFVFSNRVLLEHPKYQRLRIETSPEAPTLVKGDEVIIDDVREELPGIYKVYAWHKVGGDPLVNRSPLPSLALGPPDLFRDPHVDSKAEFIAAQRSSKRLEELARKYQFQAPVLLARILELYESDLVFRRCLRRIGFYDFEVCGFQAEELRVDPNMIAFHSRDGDEHALYIYPPSCNEGTESPVVQYISETGLIEFCAITFDAFFESELRARADWGKDNPGTEQLVALVRQKLNFPSRECATGEPPSWLRPSIDAPIVEGPAEPEPVLVSAEVSASVPQVRTGFLGALKNLFSKERGTNAEHIKAEPAEADGFERLWRRALDLEAKGDLLAAERKLLQIFMSDELDASRKAEVELRRIYEKLKWPLPLDNMAPKSS